MLSVFSSFFEGFADASAYQIAALLASTVIATFSIVYRLKRLLTPKYNEKIVFGFLILFYFLGNFSGFEYTMGLSGKTDMSYRLVNVFFLIAAYTVPLLFKEKYLDAMYLIASIKIISSIHLVAYFPFQYFRQKYNIDIFAEGLIASLLQLFCVLFALFIVRRFLLPRIEKTSKAVKIGIFSIYAIMDIITEVSNNGAYTTYNNEVIIIGIFFIITVSIAIFMVTKTIKEKEDEAKILTAMYYESDKYAYYRQIEQKNLEIRQLSHDINNHLATIRNLSENIEDESVYKYVNELISDYDKPTPSFCANRIADAVLVHEMQNAREKGVKLVISVQIPQEFFVSSVDLVSLISNIIDNAVEASQSSNEKAVDFKAFCDKHSFNIICKNTYSGELKKNGKKLLTTKQNSDNHGLGIEIIKKVVEKYNGKYNAEYSDNKFNAVVYLPYE